MSTLQNNISARRISILAQKNEKLFHIKDLANLWLIQNKNTLRVTLKRYVDGGLLQRIYRGFYSLNPLTELDPILLGAKALHTFCYLSTESILWQEGYLSQSPYAYTFISNFSKKFSIGPHNFISRKLNDCYLYQPNELVTKKNILQATPLRALADILYFNPNVYFDRDVPWNKLRALQSAIGYPLTPHRYDASKKK